MLVHATPCELYHSSAICVEVVLCYPVSGLKSSCGISVQSCLLLDGLFCMVGVTDFEWALWGCVCGSVIVIFFHLAVSCLCLVHVGRQAFGLSALLSLRWWSFLSVQPLGPLGPNAGHSDKPVMELGLQTFPS